MQSTYLSITHGDIADLTQSCGSGWAAGGNFVVNHQVIKLIGNASEIRTACKLQSEFGRFAEFELMDCAGKRSNFMRA